MEGNGEWGASLSINADFGGGRTRIAIVCACNSFVIACSDSHLVKVNC